ncbi:MAG: copper transport protein, partial [Solirubrobacteraceae bacterium]|nr:copper transport protein [Solirubrobacteraceae bacterium]
MRWVPVPVAIAASLAFAAPAFGHAAFAGSDPSAGARVETSPARVTLVFTEPLEQRLAKATIERAGGGRVPAAQSFSPGGERILLAPAQPLGTGAYVVHWHTVSDEDGHALEGAFSFGVRAAPGASAALETGPLARAGIARILARLALYVTLLTLVAALLGPLLVRRPAGWPVPDAVADDLAGGEATGAAGAGVDLANARGRYARLTGDLAWLAVAAAVASALADAADAAAGVNPSGISDFLLAGLPGAARVAVVVALVAAALLHARAPRVAAGAAVLALGALAASGHAAAAEPRTPSILNDWLHLVSGAVWLGGIALLVLVWWPVLRFTSRATR